MGVVLLLLSDGRHTSTRIANPFWFVFFQNIRMFTIKDWRGVRYTVQGLAGAA